MKTLREWAQRMLHRRRDDITEVDEARARLEHDRRRMESSASRLERSADEIHQVRQVNHISEAVAAILLGRPRR